MKKNREIKKLEDIVEFQRGLTYSKNDEVDFSDNVVLRSNNIDLIKNILDFTELKYRITDGEDINHVLLDIIDRDDVSHFLTLFNNRLKEFIEEDFYELFFL